MLMIFIVKCALWIHRIRETYEKKLLRVAYMKFAYLQTIHYFGAHTFFIREKFHVS